VVTLDVRMPVMNGIDAAKQLIAEAPHIQVIMCTAYGDDGLERTLRQNGLRTVIAKSDAPQLLVPTAEKLSVVMAFLLGTL